MRVNRVGSKLFLALILTAMIVAPILLAITLPSLEFQPSSGIFPSFTFSNIADEDVSTGTDESYELADPPTAEETEVAIEQFSWAMLALGVALLIVAAATKQGRERLLSTGVQLIFAAICALVFRRIVLQFLSSLSFLAIGAESAEGATEAPQMPPFFVMGVSLLVAIVVALIAWRLWLRFRPKPTSTSSSFVEEVQATLDRLDAGANLRETILECYRTMLLQAQRQNLVSMQGSPTTIELEQRLVKAGLPKRETGRLTRLFEQVRYGQHEASERERREARDCLVAFLDATKVDEAKP